MDQITARAAIGVPGPTAASSRRSGQAAPAQERWSDGVDQTQPRSPLLITFTTPPATLHLDGVIDESTFGIHPHSDQGRGSGGFPMLVDLAGVEFCDLAGLRATISPADGRDPGCPAAGEIILVHLPSYLATVLRILGGDATPGLTLADPGSRVRRADAPEHAPPGPPVPQQPHAFAEGPPGDRLVDAEPAVPREQAVAVALAPAVPAVPAGELAHFPMMSQRPDNVPAAGR